MTERIGAERLIELTCNPALTGFTLPKLLWVREHEPQVWQELGTVLLPKDYVRLRLSGDRATDVADASGTLLFDVTARKWSTEMLAAIEIDERRLPRVDESPAVTGMISKAGAFLARQYERIKQIYPALKSITSARRGARNKISDRNYLLMIEASTTINGLASRPTSCTPSGCPLPSISPVVYASPRPPATFCEPSGLNLS